MIDNGLNFEEISSYAVFAFVFFILTLKMIYKVFVNKRFNLNPKISKKICPFCNEEYGIGNVKCQNCDKYVDEFQKNIVCHNCGYMGEMDRYVNNSEFTITILLIWPLVPFSLAYYLFVRNKLICKKCGRILRGSDYK